MEHEKQKDSLKQRVQQGMVRREDVIRRLAELVFGKANDCVRLALEDDPQLNRLDLSLLSEIKRNEKGTVEIKLIDRLKALEQLAQVGDSLILRDIEYEIRKLENKYLGSRIVYVWGLCVEKGA